jgi:hypothetical protein
LYSNAIDGVDHLKPQVSLVHDSFLPFLAKNLSSFRMEKGSETRTI